MRVRCPSCSARLNAKPHLAGERVPCPKCGNKVLVPEPDEIDDDEEDDEVSSARPRKLVYVQKNETTGTDSAGTISLVLGFLALAALAAGWFTHGLTYYAAVALALVGLGLGFLAQGNLRIADCALNFLILLPAVVVSALLLAGLPVVKKAPVVAGGGPVEAPVQQAEDIVPMQSAAEPKWVDASKNQPIKVGNVMLLIGDVRFGVSKSVDLAKAIDSLDPDKILQGDTNGAVTEKPALLIDVQIGNPSDRIKLEFKPWSKSRGGDAIRLTDNFKNGYKPLVAPTSILSLGSNSSGSESIMPNSTIVDTLTFEQVVDKAQYLRLELSAENFGGTGRIYFQIPRSMIQAKH